MSADDRHPVDHPAARAAGPWELASARAAPRVAAVLTAVSAGAAVGLTNRADERFHPYSYGSIAIEEPTRVVTTALEIAISGASTFGNLRPLGRIVEHANYLLVEILTRVTRLPVFVVLGLVRLVLSVALALVVVRLVRRLTGGRPTSVVLATACAFPALVVAYGSGSSMVVFSGMYLATTMVVLLGPVLLARGALYEIGAPVRARSFLAAAVGGAAVALFNELAWIAAPVVVTTVTASALARRIPARAWHRVPAIRLGATATASFVAFAVPIRLYLASVCSDPATTCYAASDPNPAGIDAGLVVSRLLAGLPIAALQRTYLPGEAPRVLLVAVLVLPLLALLLVRARRRTAASTATVEDASATHSPVAGGPWWVVVVVGASLVVSGAALSALSGVLQGSQAAVEGWREAPVAFAGWAMVLGGVAGAVADRLPVRVAVAGLALGAALGVGGAVVATGLQHERDATDPRLRQTELVALEFASWDASAAGDDRRCDLVALFVELHPDSSGQVDRFRTAVETAATRRHGTAFCSRG